VSCLQLIPHFGELLLPQMAVLLLDT